MGRFGCFYRDLFTDVDTQGPGRFADCDGSGFILKPEPASNRIQAGDDS
jgi:hypothetical protein